MSSSRLRCAPLAFFALLAACNGGAGESPVPAAAKLGGWISTLDKAISHFPAVGGDRTIELIPVRAEVSYSVAYDPTLFITKGNPVMMYTAGLHMHALGKSGKISLERSDHSVECLLDVPRWKFHWQGAYGFQQPKLIGPGDRIAQECHWDNSAANQPVVNGIKPPPHDLDWGEAATDEMCLGGFYLTLQ